MHASLGWVPNGRLSPHGPVSGALGGVRRPVGHESIRFHPFGKFIDSSRRNFETQLPKMIRLITFGPTTAGRKELIRRRGGDRRHPHLLRAPIITLRPFDPSRPKAGPNLVQKKTPTNLGNMIRLITFGSAIAAHPQRGRSEMIRLITFGMATVAQDRRAVESLIRLCPSGPAPVARTCCEVWKVIRLAPSAPAPVDQTKCRRVRLVV